MHAMSAASTTTAPTGCSLVSLDGRTLPLTSVTLNADAGGGLAQVVLEQRFDNPYAEPLNLTYQLPLPADGAVVGFRFTLGEREVVGRVERKADARAQFEQAVLAGKTAALLEQDRSALFTQELGNLPPGATVVARITVECPLTWEDGSWTFRFPTVVAPRYLGGQTADAQRVHVEVADREVPVEVHLALEVRDALTGPPRSSSHVIHVQDEVITLPITARLDRDVVVSWPVAAPSPGLTLDTCHPLGDEQAYGLLTLVPPAAGSTLRPVARDLIVLLDTSGSMGGRPLDQARAFIRGLIEGLDEHDQLELIAFASQREVWSRGPTAMTPAAKAKALRWLEQRRAGGATEMHQAMIAALQPLRPQAQRQVVLVSDGLIGFERDIIGAIANDLPPSSRVHTVGVGSSVNRSLTGPSARAGGGVEIVVGLDESPEAGVRRLLQRTAQPQIVDVQVVGDAVVEVAPRRIPDLFAGAPCAIAVALRPEGGSLEIRGRTAEGTWSRRLTLQPTEPGEGRRAVVTRFAREAVEDLEIAHAQGEAGVDGRIEALGLRHQIATRLTSWLALTDEATVDPSDPTRHERVPQSLPYGMSAEGVGLRPSMPHPAVLAQAVPMSAPMAPPAPSRRTRGAPAKRKSRSWFGGFGSKRDQAPEPPAATPFYGDLDEEAVVPAEEHVTDELRRETDDPAPGGPGWELKARVVQRSNGVLVLEFSWVQSEFWAPGQVRLVDAQGRFSETRLTQPTTRSGRVEGGLTLRLAVSLADGDPLPAAVDVLTNGRRLHLVLEAS